MNSGSASIATAAAVIASTAAHKHTKKQETGDTAKSCTTYQNLVFGETGTYTEPIIVCDVDEPPTCPDGHLSVGMELFFCGVILLSFLFGFTVRNLFRR